MKTPAQSGGAVASAAAPMIGQAADVLELEPLAGSKYQG
jgi:hypothetical protein